MPTPWTTRIWHEFRAGNLTRAYRDCLLTLHTFRGPGGVAWPAHTTLASRARCGIRTVQRALRQAADLDLVSWHERRRRAAGGGSGRQPLSVHGPGGGYRCPKLGQRSQRLSGRTYQNAEVRTFQRQPTTGQPGRGGESGSKKAALRALLEAAQGLPDLLTQRRATMEQRLLTGRMAGRAGAA